MLSACNSLWLVIDTIYVLEVMHWEVPTKHLVALRRYKSDSRPVRIMPAWANRIWYGTLMWLLSLWSPIMPPSKPDLNSAAPPLSWSTPPTSSSEREKGKDSRCSAVEAISLHSLLRRGHQQRLDHALNASWAGLLSKEQTKKADSAALLSDNTNPQMMHAHCWKPRCQRITWCAKLELL